MLVEGFRTVLVLGGGNALGAYHLGVCEALLPRAEPDWVVGTSIGAVTGAILLGNRPEARLDRLREFWQGVSLRDEAWTAFMPGPVRARWSNALGLGALLGGRWGVTRMRVPGLLSLLPGPLRDVSIQDHGPLGALLGRLVDWDLLNAAPVPFTFASVDLEAGAIRWWDTRRDRIGVEHVLASTALPPLLPPVAIDGRLYWDGGLGANLPLDPVLGEALEGPTAVVASDLYAPEGEPPGSLDGSALRAQDLGFALQSRVRIDAFARERELRRAAHPSEPPAILAHLILRPPAHQRALKSLDFSATAIGERAAQGRADAEAMLRRLDSAPRDHDLAIVRLP